MNLSTALPSLALFFSPGERFNDVIQETPLLRREFPEISNEFFLVLCRVWSKKIGAEGRDLVLPGAGAEHLAHAGSEPELVYTVDTADVLNGAVAGVLCPAAHHGNERTGNVERFCELCFGQIQRVSKHLNTLIDGTHAITSYDYNTTTVTKNQEKS